ncbi:myosin head [Salpingoeca rosetta]|uniref:Myosin head n=1 Tax=Salpingoeca rosetta (strain ATCC 50818 / BSB-021) TaxID=946362 RepID=F2UD86_SALR5|nr:myosin head [Salpingoeca rosetta]EGD74581.1 myosin head [Salpingoeca rosetta]|eukprot:XP_004992838.1 myosin head [Salpingoeca rosetta]
MAHVLGEDTRDLAGLASLTEDTLVHALKTRFNADFIYTYIGDILVAINPFRPIDGMYTPTKQAFYGPAAPAEHFDHPHTFAIASRAYRAMCSLDASQCIVVNGESGAGKTESAKQIASQLIFMCGAGHQGTSLEQRILKINPILEAFGNAQTLMNDNSSRFGKYMELLFGDDGKLLGALLSEYLLEKSRVTRQAPGEQNFHVLYYLFAMDDAPTLGLESPLDFEYLQAGELEDTQDLALEVEEALEEVGFTAQEVLQVKQLLAAVLFLGNIQYGPDGDGVQVESASKDALAKVASLLKIEEEALSLALVQATARTRNEIIVRHYSEEQAIDARDAMAKAVYSRLFSWLVYRINKILCPEDLAAAARVGHIDGLCRSIGILDIFGFEHFDTNGFEQWCINLANEQLQHFFNQHVFTLEMEEYRKEGVDASDVTFLDNTPILNMYLEKPLGLLALLDEESVFPKASDSTLVAKFVRNFGKHEHFRPSLTNRPIFDVRHYAGDVTYSATGFLDKNRDRLASDVVSVLQSSELPIMTDMFYGRITDTGRLEPMVIKPSYGRATVSRKMHSAKQYASGVSKRPPSVSQHFRNSLAQLVAKMQLCSPHFVRCIKPNTNKAPWIFENKYITMQLRYTGVLDTIRIRKEGYSWRPKFQEFVDGFRTLAFAWNETPPPTRDSCRLILKKAGITSGFKMGHTKAFLKYFHKDTLVTCMDDFQHAARVLQKVIVGHLSRRRLRQFVSERETQQQQVSAFLELLELQGEGAASGVRAQNRSDDHKKHQRIKQEEERQRQEEEERKQREKARAEAERQLLERISKLEAERQSKAQETEEMLRQARDEATRREELEQLLHAEQERIREQTQKQLQERLEAEERLLQEQEKAMAVQALELERERLKSTTGRGPPTMFEQKQAQLKRYMDRMEALRCQARGITRPGVNLGIAHLAEHLKESLSKVPDPQLVAVSKTRATGFLEKQGEVRTAWKKRFFVLDLKKHSLFYCTDESCSNVKGAVQTAEMLFVAPAVDEPTGFIIGTPRRNYVMRAPSVPVRDAWLEMIRVCLPEAGRKLTSSEHVLQAEAVRAEYEDRIAVLRSQVRSLEHKLDLEKIKRVDADIRAKTAMTEKEKAQKREEELQTTYMERLVTAAQQPKADKTATLTKSGVTPTIEDPQREAIFEVAQANGRASQQALDQLNIRGFLQAQVGANAIPTRLVITQWGLQGHLTKLGSFMKTWRRRWFSLDLRRGKLAYFSDENSASELGSVALADICNVVVPQSLEAKSTNTFLVVTGKRTFNLRADTPSAMLCWYHVITAATVPSEGSSV